MSTSEQTSKASLSTIMKSAATGGLIAAVLNYVVWGIASAMGVDFRGRFQGPETEVTGIPVPMIGVSSFVPALLGGLLFFALTRKGSKGSMIFVIISVVFTLVSFAGPMAVVGASLGTKIALNVMHVIAGAAIVSSILRATKASSGN